MTLPFEPRPDSPDVNHLNALLDAMRPGTRAPDAASPEPTEAAALANAADQLRGLVRRADAPAAAYLTEHPLHNRWEDIMRTATAMAPPQSTANGAFVPSTPVSNRTRRLTEPPMSNRLNIWLSAAIVALMLLGTVGGAWWFGPGKGGPSSDDGIRLAAVTQHGATASPAATPKAVSSAPAPLMELLSAVPAELPGADDLPVRDWAYADIQQQFADLGLTEEAIAEDRLLPLGMNAFGPLVWTSGLFSYAADDELVAAIGFDPYTVQQVLTAGGAPDMVTLLRGNWDPETLTAAWEASGYTQHTTESGVTVWTLGPEGEIDPAHPVQSKMFQQLNNVAILDGGILAYTGTMETLELVLQTHAGEAESALNDAEIAPLLATVPENTISLVALDAPGSEIVDVEAVTQNPNIRPEDLAVVEAPYFESRQAVGRMPEYHGMLVGMTGGASDAGEDDTVSNQFFVRLGARSEEDAAQIVMVLTWRWENFLASQSPRPFSTILDMTEGSTHGPVAMFTFDPMGSSANMLHLLESNGLAPFAVDNDDWAAPGTPMATPEG